MTADALNQVRDSELKRQHALKDRILCCTVAGCLSAGADVVRDAIQEEAPAEIEVCGTGCMGLCSRGPLVHSTARDVIYSEVTAKDAAALIGGDAIHCKEREITRDHPFFAGQRRIILGNSGKADPERISDYIAMGGYQALLRAMTEFEPHEIIGEVKKSGLRGRGGAGYPSGLKWELVARHPSPIKYVICNADEGDPGAFMNRSVLEGDPHRVLEGMTIAARAVGARQGYIYARGESPLAIARVKTAIEQARCEGSSARGSWRATFNFKSTYASELERTCAGKKQL